MNTSRQEDGETVSNRQIGYGLVFGVPKSLSIYLAITGDQMVENIARSAVDATMCAMECEMWCKVRKAGLHEDRNTGELIYSKFFHRDSRPIDGLSDPHWHVHCFIHNASLDAVHADYQVQIRYQAAVSSKEASSLVKSVIPAAFAVSVYPDLVLPLVSCCVSRLETAFCLVSFLSRCALGGRYAIAAGIMALAAARFPTPKCNGNPWRKVWEELAKLGESQV
jgi:TrwC relaxase